MASTGASARRCGRTCDDPTRRALLACAPTAAARLRSLEQFVEQVEYNGRRLAKLNLSPAGVGEALDRFDSLLAPRIADRFQPAREQLRLATLFTLNQSFYGVREAETQAFFGLYRAETEARNLEDLLRRFVGILTQAFRARAGRLILQEGGRDRKLSRPLYIERGEADERLVADTSMRGRHASYWSYPLGEAGSIQFGFAAPYPWLPRELTLLGAVAGRCGEAIERSRLRDEVRRLEAESRHAEREERRRIGRELHDEAGQSLLLLRLKLEMMERGAPPGMRSGLAETRGIAERTVLELRRIIAALSPGGSGTAGPESGAASTGGAVWQDASGAGASANCGEFRWHPQAGPGGDLPGCAGVLTECRQTFQGHPGKPFPAIRR